jgi:hypothetical protein
MEHDPEGLVVGYTPHDSFFAASAQGPAPRTELDKSISCGLLWLEMSALIDGYKGGHFSWLESVRTSGGSARRVTCQVNFDSRHIERDGVSPFREFKRLVMKGDAGV